MGEPHQLEALAGICDPRSGVPKLVALESLLMQLSLGKFKRVSYVSPCVCFWAPHKAYMSTNHPSVAVDVEHTGSYNWVKLVMSWLCEKVKEYKLTEANILRGMRSFVSGLHLLSN